MIRESSCAGMPSCTSNVTGHVSWFNMAHFQCQAKGSTGPLNRSSTLDSNFETVLLDSNFETVPGAFWLGYSSNCDLWLAHFSMSDRLNPLEIYWISRCRMELNEFIFLFSSPRPPSKTLFPLKTYHMCSNQCCVYSITCQWSGAQAPTWVTEPKCRSTFGFVILTMIMRNSSKNSEQ